MKTTRSLKLRGNMGASQREMSWVQIRSGRTVLSVLTVLLVMFGAIVMSPPGRADDYEKKSEQMKQLESEWGTKASHGFEMATCFFHSGTECNHLNSIWPWTEEVTKSKYPGDEDTDGTRANAFKHCILLGTIVTRFGEEKAKRIGDAHEDYDIDQLKPYRKMDLANNAVGLQIGVEAKTANPNDQWGYIMDQCKAKADANELYGLDGVKGNYTNKK